MRKRTRIIVGILIAVDRRSASIGIVVSLQGARAAPARLGHVESQQVTRKRRSSWATCTCSWIPLQLHAHDLTVRHHGRTDIPPLLVVSSFIVDLKPTDLWSSTIDRVWVDGLEISIPPKDPETGKRPFPEGSGDAREERRCRAAWSSAN